MNDEPLPPLVTVTMPAALHVMVWLALKPADLVPVLDLPAVVLLLGNSLLFWRLKSMQASTSLFAAQYLCIAVFILTPTDCGDCCGHMVLRFHDLHNVSLLDKLYRSLIGPDGSIHLLLVVCAALTELRVLLGAVGEHDRDVDNDAWQCDDP